MDDRHLSRTAEQIASHAEQSADWGGTKKLFQQSEMELKPSAPRPFVKWVGGKRQLLSILQAAKPSTFNHYYEPFVGGGAFLFSNLPDSATISDANSELINCYQIIRDDVESLIRSLQLHRNTTEHFYEVRAKIISSLTPTQRASRFIFLNKTCFNGLYRENSSGQFNSPFGRYEKPNIIDKENLRSVSKYLKTQNINICHSDYSHVLNKSKAGDFIYFDPPYVPLSKTASFASYLKGGFGPSEQEKLADIFKKLANKGVFAMLSNSNTETIHALYRDFEIKTVHASRAINCKGERRGKAANEVLIVNYPIQTRN